MAASLCPPSRPHENPKSHSTRHVRVRQPSIHHASARAERWNGGIGKAPTTYMKDSNPREDKLNFACVTYAPEFQIEFRTRIVCIMIFVSCRTTSPAPSLVYTWPASRREPSASDSGGSVQYTLTDRTLSFFADACGCMRDDHDTIWVWCGNNRLSQLTVRRGKAYYVAN